MHEPQNEPPAPVSERDLDEVLRSLEVELFAPPKPRERETAPVTAPARD
jgi:hypothetical protein